jgi:hypothetical protein
MARLAEIFPAKIWLLHANDIHDMTSATHPRGFYSRPFPLFERPV